MTKLLLIDGDELLHKNLVALEKEVDWGNQIHTIHVNDQEARTRVSVALRELLDLFTPAKTVAAFTGADNFRRGILPSYKSNRHGSRKPLCFSELKEAFIAGEFPGVAGLVRHSLEADDILGMLATKPGNEDHVLVSRDKDFNSVPCNRFLDRLECGRPVVGQVAPDAAGRFHLLQTLMGDTSDGYTGCPGVGETTAAELLDKGLKFVPHDHEITKGARKGTKEIRWEREAARNPWETVVSCYRKAGLTEKAALVQARVARILRWSDWDLENRKPILWTP